MVAVELAARSAENHATFNIEKQLIAIIRRRNTIVGIWTIMSGILFD
jgi:hypothetical protein